MKRKTARLRVPPSGTLGTAYEPFRKIRSLVGFLGRMLVYNRQLIQLCWRHLCSVVSLNPKEIALYGDGDAALILWSLSRFLPVRISAVCPFKRLLARQYRGLRTWTAQQLAAFDGLVIVASFVNTAEHVREVQLLGLDRNQIVVLE